VRKQLRAVVGASVLALGLTGLGVPAGADSFTPVAMSLQITPVARLGAALPVTVAIQADAGVLDTGSGPMRMQIKLASECGGDFQHTSGVTLMDRALSPQPATGRRYQGTVRASGRPVAYGVQTVCAYLEDSNVGRVYANDQATTVTVSVPCTAAGRRYDTAARSLARARRSLRRAHGRAARVRARRLVTRRTRTLSTDRRRGVAACGRGVSL
jgi:hypothetical protein